MTIGAIPFAMALADDAKPADQKPPPPPPPKWTDAIKIGGQLDAGITWSSADSKSNKNFGRLFDDLRDRPMLNQLLFTAQRPIDPSLKTYDWGFKLQVGYGSDFRYTHFVEEFDHVTRHRDQYDLTEANVLLHTAWFTEGGLDFKAGQYTSPLGEETIDPSNNFFYSHSYIFNFGLPVKHTGILATQHVSTALDLYAGIDTGNSTSFAKGDNNGALAGIAGVGLNLLEGNLTFLGLVHFGPELPTGTLDANGKRIRVDSKYREYFDLVTVYKPTQSLQLINELDWVHDDALNGGKKADAYGTAFYAVYSLTDIFSLVGRAEVFRDADGVFVAQSGNNVDPTRALTGLAPLSVFTIGGGKTTYGEVSAGVNIKPPVPSFITGTLIRPEVRYDTSLNGTRPFNDGRDKHMVTAAFDVVVPF
jgi:hypothetical protein